MSDLGFQLISIVKEDNQLSNALNGLEYKLAYLLEEQLEISKEVILNDDSVGERLLLARKRKGLTQVDLHEMSGVSQTVISDIELSKRKLTYNTALRLSKHLDVSALHLLHGDD